MKKVLLVAALAVSSVSFAQINFGAQVGGNIANVKTTPSDFSTTSKFGITIGAVAEIPVSKSIVFRPELNFVQKGYTIAFLGESAKVSLNYFELPLNFTYNLDAGSGNLFFGAGPSIGFGISGKYKLGSETVSIKFDGKKDAEGEHLKAIDFGFGLLAGYKLSNNLSFSLGYNMGLSDIDVYDGSTTKNKGIAFKVGYMFGGKSN